MSTTFDQDGALHIPGYTFPPSELVSAEFRQAYAQHLADAQSWPSPTPPVDAPKAVWDAYDANGDRLIFGAAAKWAEDYDAVNIEDTTIAGVHVGIVTPRGGVDPQNERRVLINLHGGGFVLGRGPVAGKAESIPVAALGGIKVVTVDYRMVPYASFPAASEDVEAVYRELLKTYAPEAISIFGLSAGGVVAGQAIAWLESKGLPRPGAVGIFHAAPVAPIIRGDSAVWNDVGIFVPPSGNSATQAQALAAPLHPPASIIDYFKTAELDDPRAVPGVSDETLAKFPPTLWITGTRAFDMSTVLVYHARFLKLGVDSYLYVMEGAQHGAYAIGEHMTPEGRDAVTYIARWFQRHLAQ